jgi:uncharacterized membrane protein
MVTIQYENLIPLYGVAGGLLIISVFGGYVIRDMAKSHEQHVSFISDLMQEVEKGERLGSIEALRQRHEDTKKEQTTNTKTLKLNSGELPNMKIWIADDSNVDKNMFEESRRCLLTAYHSYVQNHAGYLIAIIIGLIALFSTINGFISVFGLFVFLISALAIGGLIVFDVLRMGYWSAYASTTIVISTKYAIEVFNDINSKKKSYTIEYPAPETAILQWAVLRTLWISTKDKNQSFLRRNLLKLELWTAGKSGSFR